MNPSNPALSEAAKSGREPVMVHILFTDVVGGSKFANEDQQRTNTRLTALVMSLPDFQEAQAQGELISIDTGDGVALVFLNRVEAPLRCAIAIDKALRADPFCKLRMGIHSGLVFLRTDFNNRMNVTGEGINFAQRVMSCGGAGHILVSDAIAGRLIGLASWKDKLTYAGEFYAKTTVVRAWVFRDGETGSAAPLPARPVRNKMRRWSMAAAAGALAGAAIWSWAHFRAPHPPERSLTYSLTVMDSSGRSSSVTEDQIPRAGARLKIQFASPQAGFLYVIAESQSADTPQWNWLFPEPEYQGGSAAMTAGSPLSIPTPPDSYIEFDPAPGRDRVHILWAEQPLEEVEAAKLSLFTRDQAGELSPGEIESIRRAIGALPVPARLREGAATVVKDVAPAFAVEFTMGHM